jgi:hypothetical protein
MTRSVLFLIPAAFFGTLASAFAQQPPAVAPPPAEPPAAPSAAEPTPPPGYDPAAQPTPPPGYDPAAPPLPPPPYPYDYALPLSAPPPAESRPKKRPFTSSARFSLGPAFRMLSDIPFYGGEGMLAIGAEQRHLALYGQLDMFFGQTQAGLFTAHIRPGFILHGIVDPVRLGGGVQFGVLTIRRSTSDKSMVGMTVGLVADIMVDLVQWDRSGLYLAASPFFDATVSSQSRVMWGATLQIGYRL